MTWLFMSFPSLCGGCSLPFEFVFLFIIVIYFCLAEKGSQPASEALLTGVSPAGEIHLEQ